MFTTYVLRSQATNRFYTGSTSDFDTRFRRHNEDASASTKHRGPWDLVYREDFATRSEAFRRERYFKSGKGREELKMLLAARKPQHE